MRSKQIAAQWAELWMAVADKSPRLATLLDKMDADRRQSMRLCISLPSRWQPFVVSPTLANVYAAFTDPRHAQTLATLAGLEDDIEHLRAQLAATQGLAVVERLNQKLNLALQSLLIQQPTAARRLNLAFEGLDLEAAQPATVGEHWGIHLGLADGYQFLAGAEVTRSQAISAGYRIGLRFNQVANADWVHYRRFVMQRAAA